MTDTEWQTYVHREDPSVRYEARRFGEGRYELRELPERGGAERGTLHAAFFEAVYKLEEGDDE